MNLASLCVFYVIITTTWVNQSFTFNLFKEERACKLNLSIPKSSNQPNSNNSKMNEGATDVTIKKYRHSGSGFMVLNALYLVLIFIFPPPLNPCNLGIGDSKASFSIIATFSLFYLTIISTLSFFIWKGKRTLSKVLFAIYGFRSAALIYQSIIGDTFPAAPYILPLLLISFYLLGRAVWDWR